MAYTLSNKHAKNCCKWTILVQVIFEDAVTCLLEHSVISCLNRWQQYDVIMTSWSSVEEVTVRDITRISGFVTTITTRIADLFNSFCEEVYAVVFL